MTTLQFGHNNFDPICLLAALQILVIPGKMHFGFDQTSLLTMALSAFPGVPIFFVISGFLVAASWESSRGTTLPGAVDVLRRNGGDRVSPVSPFIDSTGIPGLG